MSAPLHGTHEPVRAEPAADIPAAERCDRRALESLQRERLSRLLADVGRRNPFYSRKLAEAGIEIEALDLPLELARLPLTTKAELVADREEHPPWGSALSEPIERYTRYSQTSSTTGQPLLWLDTNESWQKMLDCWKAVYRGARVGPADRVFFPFSFGPFLGFWTAFDAGHELGVLCVPGGGMSSQVRLATIETVRPSVVCCTPTYALRLSEVASQTPRHARALRESGVRALVVAGEAGGSIPATRELIERSWGARVIDHYGLTETGPLAFECWEQPGGMHLIESEYVFEVLDPVTGRAVPDGRTGELVVTNLGRTASPVIRYRTGDVVVRRSEPCRCGRTWARLDGGILSRTDDMVNVRGVNVYPTAIEAVVRRLPEIAEFRSMVSRVGAMRSIAIEIELSPTSEDGAAVATRLTQQLREALNLSVPVHVVAPETLPRFEMKSRRFVVEQ
jgi:phenylacetate-CoA ligase